MHRHCVGHPDESMIPKLPPLADVLDLLPDAVCVVDAEGRFVFVSASFERIFGYAPDEVLGRRTFDLVHPDDREETLRQAEQVMDGMLQRHFRNRYVHKDGHAVDIQWSAHWLPDHGVRIGVAHEITELRSAERELEHRASHDLLTGLPNRHRLQRELRQAMERTVQGGDGLALLYLDLDGFKAVNDRSGHAAGDRALREVAHRLQQGLRHGDLVARVGGDEFVVLLPGCADAAAAHVVAGMMTFAAANDLLTLFVGLEVLSLPLYLLSGLARRRRLLSQEAALKYFLLGAFSSGFVIYGIALVYGYAGVMDFAGINDAIANETGSRTMLLIGMGMISVGLLFKVGAVPFQSWTPDVYQGAPTQVTAFMAAATKIAAFAAMMRLFYVAFGSERWTWEPMLWVIAVLSMVIGAVMAVAQSDIKRMLAYSSITHTGFLITGLVGIHSADGLADGQITATQSVLFYLVTYGFMTVGAFAVVTLVRDAGGEATHLSRWTGLGKESPVVAGVFALFLLGFAGIPLTAGFAGKWAVFASAMSAGAWPVVVIAVLTSAMAAFFYIRVIVLMYFYEPVGDGPSVTLPSFLTATAIGIGALATVVLGVVPGPLLDLAAHAGEFIR